MQALRKYQTIAKATTQLVRAAVAVMALTTLHHVYGAYRYHTPFRLHVVAVAAVVTGLVLGARWLYLRRFDFVGLSALAASTLIFPVILIGGFEGGYNHLLKNVLFFGGASRELLTSLFPPPTYELPNDWFFEITGILQIVPAALTVHAFRRFLRANPRSAGGSSRGSAAREAGAPGEY
jgi:hypothetical protein